MILINLLSFDITQLMTKMNLLNQAKTIVAQSHLESTMISSYLTIIIPDVANITMKTHKNSPTFPNLYPLHRKNILSFFEEKSENYCLGVSFA